MRVRVHNGPGASGTIPKSTGESLSTQMLTLDCM